MKFIQAKTAIDGIIVQSTVLRKKLDTIRVEDSAFLQMRTDQIFFRLEGIEHHIETVRIFEAGTRNKDGTTYSGMDSHFLFGILRALFPSKAAAVPVVYDAKEAIDRIISQTVALRTKFTTLSEGGVEGYQSQYMGEGIDKICCLLDHMLYHIEPEYVYESPTQYGANGEMTGLAHGDTVGDVPPVWIVILKAIYANVYGGNRHEPVVTLP